MNWARSWGSMSGFNTHMLRRLPVVLIIGHLMAVRFMLLPNPHQNHGVLRALPQIPSRFNNF